MTFLISPTEPLEIRALGTTSSVPETLGVDVLWSSPGGLCGVQRKAIPDLIASVRDTRLGKELEQMERLAFKALVVEGQPQWTRDGFLLESQHSRWSLKEHRGVLLSAQVRGVLMLTSRNHLESLDVIHQLEEWSRKEGGVSSMLYRGNGRPDKWGQMTDRSTGIHFLSGLPGVGIELATRIFDHFNSVPIGWTVSKEELLEIRGIGKKKVEQVWSVLSKRGGDT